MLYSAKVSFRNKSIGKVILSPRHTSSQKIYHTKTHIENIFEEVQK